MPLTPRSQQEREEELYDFRNEWLAEIEAKKKAREAANKEAVWEKVIPSVHPSAGAVDSKSAPSVRPSAGAESSKSAPMAWKPGFVFQQAAKKDVSPEPDITGSFAKLEISRSKK